MGDGDNVAYVKGSRRDWMQQRVGLCAADPSYAGCFPLVWSLSPHLFEFAPDILDWYYNQSYTTGQDFFMLPPSGDLYSYPSEFPADADADADDGQGGVQQNYVHNTEVDCTLMNTSGTVTWEWFGHWGTAVKDYLPQYSANGVVRGVFPVNVPYNIPMIEVFRPGDDFKILSGNIVFFRPREWRGTVRPKIPLTRRNYLTVEEMAQELNSLPKGTVTWIYLTSDGGGDLTNIYSLVAELDSHVQVVDQESLVDMALQRGERP
jgi:hypothetical protein